LLFGAAACSGETTGDDGIKPGDRDGGTTVARDGGEAVERDGGQQQNDRDSGVEYVTWWQDVQPIVAVKCQLCHAEPPQFGAPRPFVSYEDTQGTHPTENTPLYDVMAFRINAPNGRMPPPSQPQLTDEERRIITLWAEIGAPEGTPPVSRDGGVGTPRDGGMGGPDGGTPGRNVTRTMDIVATQPNSPDPYRLPQRSTNYVCWAVTVPPGNGNQEYMFRFEPLIDNTAHTHHTLLFKNTGSPEQEGVPFGCTDTIQPNRTMIAGWAPGRTADEIPAGAGVPITPGDQLVLQVHYDSVMDGNQTDQSGVRVFFTDDSNLEEAGMLWCGKIWFNPLNGPNETRTHTWTVSQDLTAFAVFPHMHQVGTSILLEVQRGGSGAWTRLVDIPAWDFNDQPNVPIPAAEQLIRQGDRLRTTCTWNTQGRSVPFGEASDDEMCFNFVYHYPKIGNEIACVGYGP
jgi:hypothetical protein